MSYSYSLEGSAPEVELPVVRVPPRRVGPSGTGVETLSRPVSGEVQTWLEVHGLDGRWGDFAVTFGLLPPG